MKALLILFLFSATTFAQTDSVNIKGYVYDARNGEEIPVCDVSIKNTTIKTKTDLYGYFTINSIPSGKYTLTFFYLGFDTLNEEVVVENNSQTLLKFYLNEGKVKFSGEIRAYQEPLITLEAYQQNALNDKLTRLQKDSIHTIEFKTDSCGNVEYIKLKIYETGNFEHQKKIGEWFGYWENGNSCYKAKYRQKLRFKKIPISQFVKTERNPYGTYITKEKLKLRYWMIPVDTLIEYNLNGLPNKIIHFSKNGKILDSVINIYDEQGRLRFSQNLKNNKNIEYCPHGFPDQTAGFNEESEKERIKHFTNCKWECYHNFMICPIEPFEGTSVIRTKF